MATNLPSAPTVHVCGARAGSCICIENHTTNPPNTYHVCYVCGHEWEDEMKGNQPAKHQCELGDKGVRCENTATEYVMDKGAGSWGGYACTTHAEAFPIRERLDK